MKRNVHGKLTIDNWQFSGAYSSPDSYREVRALLKRVHLPMEHFYCYILYSPSLDKTYIGSTALDPNERLSRHLSRYYGSGKFTAQAKDWEVFLEIPCDSKRQSQQIENHIKSMKSRVYIDNLRIYPDIIERLKSKYS